MKLEKFRKKLIELAEIERENQIRAMIEEMRRLNGEKREKKGRAVLGLKGKIVGEEFGFKLVKFGRRKTIETEISVGDEVLISRGNPLKSDLRGVVAEKGSKYLIVALESVPEWALKDVRVDLYASDLTFKRWIENLNNLKEGGLKALKFALGMKTPSDDNGADFTPFDSVLNASQRKAVSFALASKDFFLIHGSFGTGKTRTIAEIVRQFVKRGEKVLVTAESNTAVDNLVEILSDLKLVRLGHPSRVDEDLKKFTLSAQLIEHESYRDVKSLKKEVERLEEEMMNHTKPSPALRRGLSDDEILRLAKAGMGSRGVSKEKIRSMAMWIELRRELDELYDEIRRIEDEIAREIVEKSDVVLATNSSAFLLENSFDVVVIDEASQATLPSILIPINRAERFVLVGDHKQLPPTVVKAQDLSRTLFEILIEKYPTKSQLLEVQYRMNAAIMDFPNREFYGGRIRTHESVVNTTLKDLGVGSVKDGGFEQILDPERPLVFIDTSRCADKWEGRLADSTSRYNELECRIVEKVVAGLLRMGVKKGWIGVITPYDDQVDMLRHRVDVEVSTVDGFQGREKEVIVISFVRSNRRREIGFLEDLRRLNVSLTRAKRKLIMVGDSETLSVNSTYRRLIDHVKRKGLYYLLI